MSSISSSHPNRSDLSEQYKAQQAEKKELESSHNAEMENLKHSYQAEKADSEDRFETSIQAEKGTHYDHLRNIKSQLTREQRILEHEREEVIGQKTSELKMDEMKTERDGKSRISEAMRKYAEAETYEQNRMLNAENEVRSDHKKNADFIISDSQKRLSALAQEKTEYLDQQKTSHGNALEEIHDHFQGLRSNTEKQYSGELKSLEVRSQADLNERKLVNATALENFKTEAEDPFYTIKRFESDLLDVGDSYLLRVKVPEYERKQFKVRVSGQEVQLNGVRTNDQKTELEPGRIISTRSYQNIVERYALASPVDGRSMVFKENGEWLEYTLPKFGEHHRVSDQNRRLTWITDDQTLAKDLDFKNTLPRPASVKDDVGNGTLS